MSWTYYWAPGSQPAYWQFDYNGCPVGCGPVAWGMLFGWADEQAAMSWLRRHATKEIDSQQRLLQRRNSMSVS